MNPKSKLLSFGDTSNILRGIGLSCEQKRLKKESDFCRKIISAVKQAIRQNKPYVETQLIPKRIYSKLVYYDAFCYFKSVEIVDSEPSVMAKK